MDGDAKLKRDFLEFLEKNPNFIIKKEGRRFLISESLLDFCFHYDYPLEWARRKLKDLGLISRMASSVWDLREQYTCTAYALDVNTYNEDELVEEAKKLIDGLNKIYRGADIWVRKKDLLPLCEKHKIHYVGLLKILQKHRVLGESKTIPEKTNEGRKWVTAALVITDGQSAEILEKAKTILEQKKCNLVSRDDLRFVAKAIGIKYVYLKNILKKNGILKQRVTAYKIKL